ncbi:MAG: ERCC4 domain-containing protein [Actinomycetota bacterium]|nr:ERCC4 domain-containing protein [Actinomycetota bacterium]
MEELLIATNPDPGSRLRYLLRVPLDGGLVLRTSGTWPRTNALYCHPVPADEWPEVPEIVEQVPLRACVRRGAAIDLVADRSRENRSQIVFTTARGRQAVFWQSPRTRKQARPAVSLPSARAAGITELEILVDAHEHYPYRFASQQVRTTKRGLPCGDYGIAREGLLVAVVERKSLPDLVSTLLSGRLRYALGELAAVARAAVVVEDRYSQIFKLAHVRPALVADQLAECQVRWPTIPIVFCETRPLAEEWTYRFLAAAHTWVATTLTEGERAAGIALRPLAPAADPSAPAPAAIRAWARRAGLSVPERGRIPTVVRAAFAQAHAAHPAAPSPDAAPPRPELG